MKNQEYQPGVTTKTITATYQCDPLGVYHSLCGERSNNILLESAEIDKKHQLKSLLLTDAAVKIVCQGNIVTFTALTVNGQAAVKFAENALSAQPNVNVNLENSPGSLTATFSPCTENLDENARLKAINVFQALRLFTKLQQDNKHPFSVFLGGAFAFDLMSVAEKLPDVREGENTCPDFVFYLAETLVVIDHETQSTEIIGNTFNGEHAEKCTIEMATRLNAIKHQLDNQLIPPPLTINVNKLKPLLSSEVVCDISDDKYCTIVEDLKEHIRAGNIFQVVPSRSFELPCDDTLNAYRALKQTNPSPYMFYLKDSDFCMFGASPESALKFQADTRQVEIYPIAGTRPRGFKENGQFSPDLDSRIELELRLDKKELAEHIMLVDLARNDIARVSQPGTRHVADLLKVDRYSHVMHLVSRVCGNLSEDLDALHAYQACMNMGTLSGAPKVKATELIRQFEGKRRGSYGGAVGYLNGNGDMDTCIVIRSAFVKNNQAFVQAGAGVVFDSNPQAEANETRQKAQAVINAIQLAALAKKAHSHKENSHD